jgi:hypothetical protein
MKWWKTTLPSGRASINTAPWTDPDGYLGRRSGIYASALRRGGVGTPARLAAMAGLADMFGRSEGIVQKRPGRHQGHWPADEVTVRASFKGTNSCISCSARGNERARVS